MKKLLFSFLLLLVIASDIHSQELYDSAESDEGYGVGNSFGFTILGDGLGLMYRHTFSSEDQLGGFLGYSPLYIRDNSNTYFISGFLLKPEYNLYVGSVNREKQRSNGVKRKLKKRYISIKQGFGYASGPYKNQQLSFWRSSTTISFHQQRFIKERRNRSTGFDVGISYDYYGSPDVRLVQSPVSIYLRWDWAWFMK